MIAPVLGPFKRRSCGWHPIALGYRARHDPSEAAHIDRAINLRAVTSVAKDQ